MENTSLKQGFMVAVLVFLVFGSYVTFSPTLRDITKFSISNYNARVQVSDQIHMFHNYMFLYCITSPQDNCGKRLKRSLTYG